MGLPGGNWVSAQCVPGARLNSAHQHKHQHDDQNDPKTATGIIAPVGAVGPKGQGADEEKDKDDQQNEAHGNLLYQLAEA